MSPFQIQNAAEAIQKLTEDAATLAAKLGQLIAGLQQSSSTHVASTSQHLALYQEAVQTLQVVTTTTDFSALQPDVPVMILQTLLRYSTVMIST